MGNDQWWLNRMGKFASQSNPGSAVPNYGLTMDVATAPWQDQQQFNALLASQITSTALGAVNSIAGAITSPAVMPHQSLWDKGKSALGWAGQQAAGAVGGLDSAVGSMGGDSTKAGDYEKLSAAADAKGLTGWEKLKFIGSADVKKSLLGESMDIAKDPIASKVFWGLDKVSEGSATAFTAASVADAGGNGTIFNGSTWAKAHAIQQRRHENAGQAFAQMFQDDEVLDDDKRYAQLRQHSTAFNVSALGFNVIASWKFDPNVILGKGMGAVRDVRRGALAATPGTAAIQRDVIGAGLEGGRQAAQEAARNTPGIMGRVHAQHAVSLYDQSVAVRQAAKDMRAEDFIKMPMFRTSTNGSIMAQLMREAAGKDEEWNLLFRTSMGDPKALEALASKRGEFSDKINAIQNTDIPQANAELDRVLGQYDKRLAEQGKLGDADPKLSILTDSDWFLHTETEAAKQQVDDLHGRFASYQSSSDFLDRALRGTDDSRQTGAVFNGLDAISTNKGFGTPGVLTAKVSTWQHDHFSPVVRVVKFPGLASLKRVGAAVDLHDVESGVAALDASLNQMDHIVGASSAGLRDQFFQQYAASGSDVTRRNILADLHHTAFHAIAKKHGIDDPAMMKKFTRIVLENRNQNWVKMSDQTQWRKLTHSAGQADALPFVDGTGGLNYVHAEQGLDVTQLQNHFPMVNWTDLDHTIRLNKDIFTEMSSLGNAGLMTRRKAESWYEFAGSTFNSLWKPLALISLRWPMRVLGDEGYRIQHVTGVMPYLGAITKDMGNTLFNKGIAKPRDFFNGRRVATGPTNEESLRPGFDKPDEFDHRAEGNPQSAMPVEATDFNNIDQSRYDHLQNRAQERRAYLSNEHLVQADRMDRAGGTPGFGIESLKAQIADLESPKGGNYDTELSDHLSGRNMGNTHGRARVVGPALQHAVAGAPVTKEDLFRGSRNRALRPGDEFSYDTPASFSTSKDAAETFSIDGGKDSAIYRIVGDKKALPIRTLRGEAEHLAGGKFRVRSVSTHTRSDGVTVPAYDVEQVSAFGAEHTAKVEGLKAELAAAEKRQANYKPSKPGWAQQWGDRLSAAEKSDNRGFFFDPVSHKAANKGYAVSVYPGRLRTFEHKPSAAALNDWMDHNSDLLAIPGNRVGTWLDKETNRWHLDVIKHHKRVEDAMMTAAKSNANEFYDVGQGFTRFVDQEDPFQHYSSPFVVPDTTNEVLGGAVPQAQEKITRKRTGVGVRTYHGPNGEQITGEGIYGLDPNDMNIWASVNSSKEMGQALYGGHTKGMEGVRNHNATLRDFKPGEEGSAEAEDWTKAWAFFVNNHVRRSPVWLRMLNGQTDDQIANWMMTREGRTMIGERLGHPPGNPLRYVQEKRAMFEHLVPTDQAKAAVAKGEVTAGQADELVPHDVRDTINSSEVALLNGGQQGWNKMVSKVYGWLGSLPNDRFVRHPFASLLYDTRMKNYIASLPEGTVVTNAVLNAAEAEARGFANKQIKRYLYNISDENNATHMMRFIAPFAQAQYEVLDRYLKIFTEHPESLARTLQLYLGSQQKDNGVWQTLDENGKPTTKFSHNNKIVFQVTPAMRHMAANIPGLNKVLNEGVGSVALPVSSLDLILQGDNPVLPSLGPIVTIPASELYFQKHPFASEGGVTGDFYKWMFPFGQPTGSNPFGRVAKGVAPAYVRRITAAVMSDAHDSAFMSRVAYRYQDKVTEWERQHNGVQFPTNLQGKFTKEAESETKAEYLLRAASSFLSPVPVEARSPQQFWIDQARQYRSKYGTDAMDKFYDDFGPDYFRYFQEVSKTTNGMAPTAGAARAYSQNKSLIDEAPDLAGVLIGPYTNGGDFNSSVYQWQLQTPKGPGSKDKMRELLSPTDRIAAGQEAAGWIEYGKLSTAVTAELRTRVSRGMSASLNANSNADLSQIKAAKIAEIMKRNPAWEPAYNSRQDKMTGWLRQAYGVAFDKKLDGRTDIEGLRAYLKSRQMVRQALNQRQAAGGSGSLGTQDPLTGKYTGENADLAEAWSSYTSELTSKNLLFAEIYNRYLESDDLTALRG